MDGQVKAKGDYARLDYFSKRRHRWIRQSSALIGVGPRSWKRRRTARFASKFRRAYAVVVRPAYVIGAIALYAQFVAQSLGSDLFWIEGIQEPARTR